MTAAPSTLHETMEFPNTGETFSGLYAAERWLVQNGYSYGSLCGNQPVCVLRGRDYAIAKWKNLTRAEREACHGKLEGDFRNGTVTLTLLAK